MILNIILRTQRFRNLRKFVYKIQGRETALFYYKGRIIMKVKINPKERLEKAQKMVEEKPEEFRDFEVCGHYSVNNQMLICYQCPWAKEVKGYKAWKSEGRQVQKGQKSIRIFAPLTKKIKETNDEEVFGFRLVPVFDISQTEIIEEEEYNDEDTVNKHS